MSSLFFKRPFRPSTRWYAWFGSNLELFNAFKVRLYEYWKLESARLGKRKMGNDKMPTSLVKKTVLTGAMLLEVEAVADLWSTLQQANQDALANEILDRYISDFFTRNDNGTQVVRTRNHLVENFASDCEMLNEFKEAYNSSFGKISYMKNMTKEMHYAEARAQLSKLIAINAQLKLIDEQDIMIDISSVKKENAETKRAARQQLKQDLEKKYAEVYKQAIKWMTLPKDPNSPQQPLPETDQNKNPYVECALALERIRRILGRQSMININEDWKAEQADFQECLNVVNHVAPIIENLPKTDKDLLNVLAEHRGYNPLVSYNPIFWMINQVRALFGFSRLQWSTGDHHVVQFIRNLRIFGGLGVGLYEEEEAAKPTPTAPRAHT